MAEEKTLDIIGMGKPVKDLLVAVDDVPTGDGFAIARAVSSQGGGNCASAIVAAARQGMRCGMYANIGDDAKGRFCRDDFVRHGVDVSHLKLEEGKTTPFCLCIAEISTQTRRFIGSHSDSSALQADSLDYDYLRQTRLIHFDNGDEASRAAAIFARENGIITSIDAGGYRKAFEEMEPLIDLFVASAFYMEGRFPGKEPEEAVRLIARAGCRCAVITLGSEGLVGCCDGEVFRLPAFRGQEIIDTTGAGDVFHGGFASAWLMGLDPVECARYASAVSYIKCTRLGGRAGIPTREMVEHYLKTGEILHPEELDARSAFYRDLVV